MYEIMHASVDDDCLRAVHRDGADLAVSFDSAGKLGAC